MSNVVELPQGRQRKRRLREARATVPPEDTKEQPKRTGLIRRSAKFCLWLAAHLGVSTVAALLSLFSRIAFMVAKFAVFGTALVAIVECLRHWQDLDVFLPLMGVTAGFLVAYLLLEGLAQAAYYLQYHIYSRRTE